MSQEAAAEISATALAALQTPSVDASERAKYILAEDRAMFVTTFVPADAVSRHLAYIPCIAHGPLATLHHGCNPVTHVRACDPTSHVPNTPFPRFPCPSSCTIVPFSQPSPGASRAIVLTSTIACSLLLSPVDRHPPHQSAIVPIMYICTQAPAVWLPSLTS